MHSERHECENFNVKCNLGSTGRAITRHMHLNCRCDDIAKQRECGLYLTKLPEMLKMMSATTPEKECSG